MMKHTVWWSLDNYLLDLCEQWQKLSLWKLRCDEMTQSAKESFCVHDVCWSYLHKEANSLMFEPTLQNYLETAILHC